jgi:GntR family transcriptional regulator, transcriptional repressor for pyruvate dehydrogenase complex
VGPERVTRQRLSDDLVLRVRQLIEARGYRRGDRLPSIAEMSGRFGVAHPTLREALRKLEAVGLVEIRHGSGVYVSKDQEPILVGNPVLRGRITQKLLLDLNESRIPLEVRAAVLAAERATDADVRRLRKHLGKAEQRVADGSGLGATNLSFHVEIAAASGNSVLHQLLEVLGSVIQEEQHILLERKEVRERFHAAHVEILEAVEARDPVLAGERMGAHLEEVRQMLLHMDLPQSES